MRVNSWQFSVEFMIIVAFLVIALTTITPPQNYTYAVSVAIARVVN